MTKTLKELLDVAPELGEYSVTQFALFTELLVLASNEMELAGDCVDPSFEEIVLACMNFVVPIPINNGLQVNNTMVDCIRRGSSTH